MTYTVQPHSEAMSGITENDVCFLLYLQDSLTNLSIALKKMDNVQNNLCKKLTTLEHIVRNI